MYVKGDPGIENNQRCLSYTQSRDNYGDLVRTIYTKTKEANEQSTGHSKKVAKMID